VAQQQHEDWFERQFDLDETTNHFIVAKNEYNRGWISYLTAVWQMLREKIEAAKVVRLKALQKTAMPEIPKELNDFFEATGHPPTNQKGKRSV
jgi:hypothetical protein